MATTGVSSWNTLGVTSRQRRARILASGLSVLAAFLVLAVLGHAALSFVPSSMLRQVATAQAVLTADAPRMTANVDSAHGETGSRVLPMCLGVLAGCAAALRRWRSPRAAVSRSASENAPAGIREGASVKLFSPAKVNLFLKVLRKRPDGFHDLASLFHTIAFGDEVTMELLPESSEEDELSCNLPGVPTDSSNFAIKSLELFRLRTGLRRHFRLRLEKKIPAQAGMGGGSSNAATALYGANYLCGSPASPAQLLEWAKDPMIGSDAAFFLLSNGVALCTGRGEIVDPVDPLPNWDGEVVHLIKPRAGLSTPKVFKALRLEEEAPAGTEKALLDSFETHGLRHEHWVNDLETPAFEVAPELGELRDFLARSEFGFRTVLMSGSGSTLVCIGEPSCGASHLEDACRAAKFDLELMERTRLSLRSSADAWYRGIGTEEASES